MNCVGLDAIHQYPVVVSLCMLFIAEQKDMLSTQNFHEENVLTVF